MGIPIFNMDYLQADNQLNTFAHMTGGRAYFPRFQGELPEIFHDIGCGHSQPVLVPTIRPIRARRHLSQAESGSGGARMAGIRLKIKGSEG